MADLNIDYRAMESGAAGVLEIAHDCVQRAQPADHALAALADNVWDPILHGALAELRPKFHQAHERISKRLSDLHEYTVQAVSSFEEADRELAPTGGQGHSPVSAAGHSPQAPAHPPQAQTPPLAPSPGPPSDQDGPPGSAGGSQTARDGEQRRHDEAVRDQEREQEIRGHDQLFRQQKPIRIDDPLPSRGIGVYGPAPVHAIPVSDPSPAPTHGLTPLQIQWDALQSPGDAGIAEQDLVRAHEDLARLERDAVVGHDASAIAAVHDAQRGLLNAETSIHGLGDGADAGVQKL